MKNRKQKPGEGGRTTAPKQYKGRGKLGAKTTKRGEGNGTRKLNQATQNSTESHKKRTACKQKGNITGQNHSEPTPGNTSGKNRRHLLLPSRRTQWRRARAATELKGRTSWAPEETPPAKEHRPITRRRRGDLRSDPGEEGCAAKGLPACQTDVGESDKVSLLTQLRRDSNSLLAPPVTSGLIMAVTFTGLRNAGFSQVFMNI